MQKDLENVSREGSVPLAQLWLEVCPGQEHWQQTGQSGCSASHRLENKWWLTSCGTQPFGMGKKNPDLKLGCSMAARHPGAHLEFACAGGIRGQIWGPVDHESSVCSTRLEGRCSEGRICTNASATSEDWQVQRVYFRAWGGHGDTLYDQGGCTS